MCGIAGIIQNSEAPRVMRETVERMCDAIAHRGPDDCGYYFTDHDGLSVNLGMRRLTIIDLISGHQPISNEDKSRVIVFNGEIYNYRELRRDLAVCGHRFLTNSDTETILHEYEEQSENFLSKLRGMFAIAIWDQRDRKLTLAVDRFGIKPLYYAADSNRIVFGSELKCLVASGLIPGEMDDAALAQYFTFGYIPPPATIYRSARKLAPAQVLEWSLGKGAKLDTYWELPYSQQTHSSQAQIRRRTREALQDAVSSHLVSDVPIGAFLSGGIDSSSIVALMSEVSPAPVKTFSIGFREREHNEFALARLVAKKFKTDHHELMVEPEAVEVLPRIVAAFDEPFADSSSLPTYYISKLARPFVKVVLSGDGGDELFLGYTIFRGLELARHLQLLPHALSAAIARILVSLPSLPGATVNDRFTRLKKRASDSLLPPPEAYFSKITTLGLEKIAPLLGPELRQRLQQYEPLQIVKDWLARSELQNGARGSRDRSSRRTHPLEPFVRVGLQVSLAGDMLVKVDRMSMAHSLEVRVPFLDHFLAQHVATLPIEARFPRWRLKALLKDTMRGTLPAQVLHAPKHGFTVPLASWFRGDLAGYAGSILLGQTARSRGLWNLSQISQVLEQHRVGRRDLSSLIWSLLVFELWCRQNYS